MTWLNGWLKRKIITLTGNGNAQTDYQVKLTVTYDSDMKSDFSDLRFTKADGATLLDAWLESKTDDTSAVIWVKTDTPANTVEADIYMYYGNSGASADWDGDATFIEYADFEDGTLQGWAAVNVGGTCVQSVVSQGNYAVELVSAGGLEKTGLSLNDVVLEYDFYYNYTSSLYQPYLIWYDGATQQYIHNNYYNTQRIYYVNSSGTSVNYSNGAHTDTPGVWAHWELTYHSASPYINAKKDSTDLGTGGLRNTPHSAVDKLYFCPGSSNSGSYGFLDNIRIRKYTANPVTYAFGSEKTVGWYIEINDVLQDDFAKIHVIDTIAGTKKCDVIFSGDDKETSFNHYDDIKIYGEDGNIIFRGRIEEMIPDHNADTTIIAGRDYLSELIDKYVVEAYTDKLRSYIVDDIVDKNSTAITRTNIQASPAGTELTYTFKTSVWDILVGSAKDDKYRFWVDTSNDLHYVEKGYTDSGLSLILGTSDIISFDIEERSGEIINRVTIYGGGSPQTIVMLEDAASQTYYRIVKEKRIVDDQIDTVTLATAKAQAYLDENAWVLEMITFEVDGYESLNAGELIHVTISSHSIDGDYLVISKEHNFPSNITKIHVAKYVKNLESIISNLIDRLIKVEQTFIDESAIMARIERFYEQQGYTDTIKIYSRTVGDSFLLGVTGHCEMGNITLKSERGTWTQKYSGS